MALDGQTDRTTPWQVTLWICDKGHVGLGTLNGVCWSCFPGGRRTWEAGQPKQEEPNQRPYVYELVGPKEEDESVA